MADASVDPFANGANPFDSIGYADGNQDALPPLTVTRGPSSTDTPPASTSSSSGATSTPPTGVPPSTSAAPSTPADPFAGGANPFDKIGYADDPVASAPLPSGYVPGALGNSTNDGWLSGTAKNAATTAIKGLSHGPGFVGDIDNFADAAMEVPEWIESKITGQPFADVVAKRNALGAQSRAAVDADQRSAFGFSLDPRHYFPSGSEVAAPILAKTGAYQPTTALGRFGSAAGEAVLGGLGPGGGAMAGSVARDVAPSLVSAAGDMARGVVAHAPANAAAGVSSQAASDATGGDPLAASMAGIGVPSVLGAAHGFVADRPARKAASVLAQGTADPQAALDAIRNRPEDIPGVAPTTAQVTQDPGVFGMQTAATGTQARGPQFAARQQQQGRGMADALDALKPGGDPQQVASFFLQKYDDIGDRTQALVDQHLADAQSQADALRGQGLPVDAYGSALRGKISDAYAARDAAEDQMWTAVDPERRLTNDLSGVKQTAAQVYGSDLPAADRAKLSDDEKLFTDLIGQYPDVVPLREVASLKSNLAAAMRDAMLDTKNRGPYARMSRLMKPIQASLNGTVSQKVAADNAAVAAGTMAPEDTLAAQLQGVTRDYLAAQGNAGADAGERASATGTGDAAGIPAFPRTASEGDGQPRILPRPQAVQGDVPPAATEAGSGQVGSTAPEATRPVYSPSGAIGVRNELAEHSDLITSHDADFRPRPDYPQNLQPRARDGAAAQDQVNGMAARLNPERLGPSPEANAGAPIVGPDNVVESGNGRTMAIGKAYDAGGAQADAYRQHLEGLGYDTTGYSKPVLIARRITPMEPDQRELFTHAANDATALRMGSAEQAAADASRITPGMLDAQAGSNLSSTANRPFVGSFMSTLPAAERGALVDGGGNLSASGVRRIQGAMAAHAYGDKGVVARAFDDPEPNVKGLAGALTDAAGPWAKMRAAVSDGSISPEHDVTPELMQGVKLAMRARDEGRPIGELLAQRDLFQSDTSRLVTAMLTNDGNRLASRPQIEANLRTYAEEAVKNSADKGLFGGAAPVDDVLKASQAKAAKDTGSGTSKLAEGPMFSDVPPPPSATYNEAAGARYKAANAFTKESHAIYGAKPISDILAEQGGRGNYRMPASAVPGKLFGKGPAGYEHVQAFRRSVGDDGAAMHILRDHALDDLQRVARKPDGTLDDAKLAKWRSDHSEALRAFPELSSQLESAGAATRTFTEASAQRRDLIRQYEKSVFGKLMGASHPAEVTGIIGNALQRSDRINVFRKIAQQVQHDPVAMNGLRQAFLEHLVGKSVADIEGATGAARTLKSKQFLEAYSKYLPVAKEVLPDRSVGMLHRVAQMAPRMSEALEGASKQPKNLMRFLEASKRPHEPLIERLWKPALAMREFRELGKQFAGEYGELGAAAVGGLAIGKRAIQAIRNTGARKVGDVITDALLNPERYASLIQEAHPQPDKGPAAALAYHLRGAAMYGGDAMGRISAHIATRAGRLADRADDERRRKIHEALGIAPQARASGGRTGSDDAPVAKITGEEIAPRSAPNHELREAGRRYYEANLRGTRVFNSGLGKHIEFRSSKKAFSVSGDPDKIRAFAALRDVLGKGKVLSSAPPHTPAVEPSTRAYHKIGAPISMAGDVRHVHAIVREDTSGNLYYDHRVGEAGQLHQSRPEDTEDKSGPGRADGGAVPSRNIGDAADAINLTLHAPKPERAAGGSVKPTDAQKEAGNYRKDHIRLHDMDVSIENRKGTERSGIGKDGRRWSVKMPADYGYIRGTTRADGDHVDCYVGPYPLSSDVFIIDQLDLPSRTFDEHKVMFGFKHKFEAVDAYEKGFSDGKGEQRIGKVTEMPIWRVKAWAQSAEAKKPSRARGGALGFGSSSQPFGVPSFGQMFGPTKKAGSLFADGGSVDQAPAEPKPQRSVEDSLAEFEGHLDAARDRLRRDDTTRSIMTSIGMDDPVKRALIIMERRGKSPQGLS